MVIMYFYLTAQLQNAVRPLDLIVVEGTLIGSDLTCLIIMKICDCPRPCVKIRVHCLVNLLMAFSSSVGLANKCLDACHILMTCIVKKNKKTFGTHFGYKNVSL